MDRRPFQRWLAAFGATMGTELRRFLRDRAAVLSAFVLPIAMAVLVSLALGGDPEYDADFVVVDRDGGLAADAFFDQALGHPAVVDMLDVERVATEAEARRLVDGGSAHAGIVLPAGLSTSLGSDAVAPITVLRSEDEPVAGDLAALVVDQFTLRAQAAVLAGGGDGDSGTSAASAWPLEVALTAPDGERLDGPTAAAPPVALFFLLVTLGFAAHRLVMDRQRGIVERLAAAPLPVSALLAGRTTAAVAVGGLSMATLMATLQLAFGRSWGPIGPLTAVVLAAVLAMAGVAALIAALARTPGQVQTFSVGVAFTFLLASGSLSFSGRPRFAELVPNTHVADALALLATERAGLGSVAGSVAVLAGIGAAGLLVAALTARRLVA